MKETIEVKITKKFIKDVKTGDRVQMSKYKNGEHKLLSYDVAGIEPGDPVMGEFQHAKLSLIGVNTDYVGVERWYMSETIDVFEIYSK